MNTLVCCPMGMRCKRLCNKFQDEDTLKFLLQQQYNTELKMNKLLIYANQLVGVIDIPTRNGSPSPNSHIER